MSTEGAGCCVLTLNSPFIAAIGVGVVVGEGMVVVGEEVVGAAIDLAKDVVNKGKEERKEQFGKMQAQQQSIKNLGAYLSSEVEALAVARLYQDDPQTQRVGKVQQQYVTQIAARARAAVTDTSFPLESAQEIERRRFQLSLRREIIAGREILPAALIEEAELALEDTNETMARLVYRLQVARQEAEAALSEQQLQRRQVEDMTQFVTAQLQALDQVLQEMSSEQQAGFVERRRAIQAVLATIDPSNQKDLESSVEEAIQAHQSARQLTQAASIVLIEAWSEVNRQGNRLLGMLQQLHTMVDEIGRVHIAERRELNSLTRRLSVTLIEAESLGQYALRDAQQRLSDLTERSLTLKEEVFTVVEQVQQRIIAETIASTLLDLDYRPLTSDQRLIRESGEVMRVLATPGGKGVPELRDDRIVAFDISRKGAIAYDFIGYTGDTCVEEAEKILAALKERGLYILDKKAVDQLRAEVASGRRITPEMLDRPELQLNPIKNKLQTTLAERIHAVLERMDFHTIVEQVVGGRIEMDAFNGPIGYRVVLTPEGSMKMYKDAELNEVDLALDNDDPVVVEARQVTAQQPEVQLGAPEKRQQSRIYRQRQALQE